MVKFKKTTVYIAAGILVLAALIIGSGATGFAIFNNEDDNGNDNEPVNAEMKEFNDCLAEKGVVIYGANWCPYCTDLVEALGGYNAVESVYVECTEEQQRCTEEMIGRGVPEIQINGELYEGPRTLEALSEATGCQLN